MLQEKLQGKLSDAHLEHTLFGMELVKEFQTDIEHGDGISQASLDVSRQAMMDFLGFADDGNHRKRCFDDHAVIPGAFLAQLDVARQAVGTAKAPICQQNGFAVVVFKEVQKIVVWAVHGIPNPTADLSKSVEYPAQLHAHAPPTFILAL